MTPTRAFHAMAKPAGPDCNLRCRYCFYREKEALYPAGAAHRMSEATLEAYVRNYLSSLTEGEEAAFTWQGGEPTLMGLDFFRRAVELQWKYGRGRRLSNSFQTNGVLIDEPWAEFLAEHDFLVGLSLDGPARLHDRFRPKPGGRPSHSAVMRAANLFQRHNVAYNALVCLNRESAEAPGPVYDFLLESGVRFIQFLPVVERRPTPAEAAQGLVLGGPDQRRPDLRAEAGTEVTDWSVRPEDYGRFLTEIFDRWVRRDVGQVFVLNFEWALANFMGRPGAVCHHQPTCGRSVAVEHNGDVFACDHYVYPEYRLGNLRQRPLAEMVDEPEQEAFGRAKYERLPQTCLKCPVLPGCWGGCPKHRFITNPDDFPLNYLCPGLKHFFGHLTPYLKALADLLTSGRPASDIMAAKLVFLRRGQGKNPPAPAGSGPESPLF